MNQIERKIELFLNTEKPSPRFPPNRFYDWILFACFLFFRGPLPPLDSAGPRRHRAADSEIAGIFGPPPKSPVITVRPPAPPSVPGRTAFRTTPPPVATGTRRWKHCRARPDPPPGGDRYRCSSPRLVATGTSRWTLFPPPSQPHTRAHTWPAFSGLKGRRTPCRGQSPRIRHPATRKARRADTTRPHP